MNAVTKIDPLKEKTITVQANQGFVSGRLGDRRKFKTKDGVRWFQLLLTPAPDPYSMPQVVELKSIQALGNEGDDWSGVVRLCGYPNTFSTKPDSDGVVAQIKSAYNILEVIE